MDHRVPPSFVFSLSLGLNLACGSEFEAPDLADGESTAGDDSSGDASPEFGSPDDPQAITSPRRIDDTNVDPRWPEVVSTFHDGGLCSGTLISPVHVLTAGHCGRGRTVQLDTPIFSGPEPSAVRQYNVIETDILSGAVASGQDLALLLLERPVPSFGREGAPEYAISPAFALAHHTFTSTVWTVGFGTDCGGGGYGTRRGLEMAGPVQTFPGLPGVVALPSLGCHNPAYEGPNTGDSGGPLFDTRGRVVGVFSGWICRNMGGPSCVPTTEWTGLSPGNDAFIVDTMARDFDGDGILDPDDPRPGLNCTGPTPPAGCAEVKPELQVTDVRTGCTGVGGSPVAMVTVRNTGPVAASAWIDLWTDRSTAPAVGELSSNYARTPVLAHGQSATISVPVTPATLDTWVDVVVDTIAEVDELDETNNVYADFVGFPRC